MTIKVKIEGLDELRKALHGLERKFDEAVSDAVAETAFTIQQRVKLAIARGPNSGRIYQKSNPRRTHQASAPGEAPASDTGTLAASVYADIHGMAATIGSRLAYAHYLEFGTRRMAPRPVWVRTATEEGQLLRDRIMDNLRQYI